VILVKTQNYMLRFFHDLFVWNNYFKQKLINFQTNNEFSMTVCYYWYSTI